MKIKILAILQKELKRRITIMLIPHGKIKPRKLSVSILFLAVALISWTSVTVWTGYIAGQHIDYIKTKTDNKIMKIRLLFFADQIEKTKNLFEKVQVNDDKLRSLLALDSKKSIIEEGLGYNFGEGGPTAAQANAFALILKGNINKIDSNFLSLKTNMLKEQYNYMQKSYTEIMSHIQDQKSLFMATPRGWPAEGRISSVYGFRYHPFFQTKDLHSGLDIANRKETPVRSTANGKVIFSGWQSGYGNIIVIDHGYNYRTAYAHLAKRLKKVGDYVQRGDEIALMGSTGATTGTHVHYEVHYKGKPVNPMSYLQDYFFTQSERNYYDKKKFKKFA
ncbi:MAG: M23 family metallopeptidase [Endomicrobium sp.]|jgi:murein DD-endopeptidase MepM/ murein hydrolase activator NlpD|nr:M23 family metallopeptidase [Endomicrobium sp.]